MLHTYHLISNFILSFIFQNYRYLFEWYYCHCSSLLYLIFLGITCFYMYTSNMSMLNSSVKLILEISLHLNICTRWLTTRISYKICIYICNVCAHGHLCVCVCVCVCDIPLSVSHVNRMKKEIRNCMGTIRRLRHWFVIWHHTNHNPSAPLIFASTNILILLISQTTRYHCKTT